MGSKVWAFRVGNFVKATDTGWSHSIHFDGLGDLLKALEEKSLRRKIETLAIVAHGDAGGVVQLDSEMTPATFSTFAGNILKLRDYFEDAGGKLIFLSCIAAVGPSGTELLVAISRIVTNVHVIGFTVNGVMSSGGLPSVPGSVLEGDGTMAGGVTAKMMKNMPVMTEYSVFSKWARNGYITKLPYQEQVKVSGYKCAWSACPGHKSPVDRCVPALKGVGHSRPYPG